MSSLSETIALYRRRLLAQESGAVATLESAYAQVLVAVQPQLDNIYKQIQDKKDAGESIPPSWIYEQNRLTSLKFFLQNKIDEYAMLALNTTGHMQRLAIALGTESAQALLRASTPAGIAWAFGVPSPAAIASLIGATQAGSPLARLFRGFGLEAARNVGRALVTGLTLGWNPRRIAPLVERALNVPRWRALTIARTEMLRCYKGAALENYKQNSDVVDKWIWHSALNRRTCASCIAMHGTEHDLSEDLNGHPCCRCARIPKTRSWKDILGDDSIPDTRPKEQSGTEWLGKQSEATQRAILQGKYEGWKEGKFELSDVVRHKHDKEWGSSIGEKSLKQLVKG